VVSVGDVVSEAADYATRMVEQHRENPRMAVAQAVSEHDVPADDREKVLQLVEDETGAAASTDGGRARSEGEADIDGALLDDLEDDPLTIDSSPVRLVRWLGNVNGRSARCRAIKGDGERCENGCGPLEYFCGTHEDVDDPDTVDELEDDELELERWVVCGPRDLEHGLSWYDCPGTQGYQRQAHIEWPVVIGEVSWTSRGRRGRIPDDGGESA